MNDVENQTKFIHLTCIQLQHIQTENWSQSFHNGGLFNYLTVQIDFAY